MKETAANALMLKSISQDVSPKLVCMNAVASSCPGTSLTFFGYMQRGRRPDGYSKGQGLLKEKTNCSCSSQTRKSSRVRAAAQRAPQCFVRPFG